MASGNGFRPHRERGPWWSLGPVALMVGMFILALVPRAFDLHRIVTPDEPLWLARSANFSTALASGELDATYQYVHPGVTVMWLGTVGLRIGAPNYARDAPGQVRQRGNVIESELRRQGLDPLLVLVRCRQVLAVAIALTIGATCFFAVRLLGTAVGVIGSILLAFDPFHVALSRLLHLDGLFSCLLILAACAWLVYLTDRHWGDLVVAGIALGLAGLTRSVAIVLLPMVLVSLCLIRPALPVGASLRSGLWERVRPTLALGGVALATVVACWPAMWTRPVGTIQSLVEGTRALSGRAHEGPVFFRGQIYVDTDPGPLFYPVSLLWRSTPALLIGLLLAVAVLLLPRGRREAGSRPVAVLHLVILALSVLALISLSDKKLDRYAVPAVPALAFVAAWGWVTAVRWLMLVTRLGHRRFSRLALAASGALLVLFGARDVLATHPYGLDYYNPIMGGGEDAPAVMMVGWGEGLDQIAHAIDALPNAPNLAIGSSAWSASISYFLHQASVHTVRLDDPASALPLLLTQDYFVRYVTADQRGYVTPEAQAFLDSLTPIVRVRLNEIEYAALYDLRGVAFPADLSASQPTAVVPGVQLVLVDAPTEPIGPGAAATIRLYLTGEPANGSDFSIDYILRDAEGNVVLRLDKTVRPPATDRAVWKARLQISMPPDLPEGRYEVAMHVENPDAAELGTEIVLGSIAVESSGEAPGDDQTS
jgi:hypothetical protein